LCLGVHCQAAYLYTTSCWVQDSCAWVSSARLHSAYLYTVTCWVWVQDSCAWRILCQAAYLYTVPCWVQDSRAWGVLCQAAYLVHRAMLGTGLSCLECPLPGCIIIHHAMPINRLSLKCEARRFFEKSTRPPFSDIPLIIDSTPPRTAVDN
jgi:hypothetical protein